VLWVLRELLEIRVQQEHKDHKEFKVQLDFKDDKVFRD
jgi:hypothetical protein